MINNHSSDELRQQLRMEAIARRDLLPPSDRSIYSRAATALLKTYLESIGATFLHCYINFRTEVETRGFIEECLERGLRVVVPVVEELDDRQFLIHTEIKGLTGLQRGAFGLEEPIERSPSTLESLDAVILPLVGFDRRGTRLGYGKGFYDRFLHDLPRSVLRIGLAFSIQEIPHIPDLPHDEPLDYVITEHEIIQTIRADSLTTI
jgi:5-formyltetrahydrofolate cyclo-ligase